jgi:hypothetical protein
MPPREKRHNISGIAAHCDLTLQRLVSIAAFALPETTMARRATTFFLAIFASVIMSSMTMSYGAPAADTCRSAPKDNSPEGSHWYYRTDRNTNRKCWYLREESDKVSQSEKQSDAAKPKSKPVATRSLANALAETPMPHLAADGDTGAANTPADSTEQSAGPAADSAQETIVATRWPYPANSTAPVAEQQAAVSPQPAAPDSVTEAPNPQQAPSARAAAHLSEKPTGSIPTLLLVILGALALAGLTGSIVVIHGGRRHPHAKNAPGGGRRRVNWELASERGGPAPWAEEMLGPTPWVEETPRSEFARTPERPARQQWAETRRGPDHSAGGEEVTEMLERLIQSGPKLSRPISATGSASYGHR